MNLLRLLIAAAVLSMLAAAARAETVAETVLASYDPVKSVTCQVRKDTESAAGKVRMLSRVYFQKPDRLHVDNYSPVVRRIVCDGSTFYSYIQGDPKGFSRPVSKLDEEMAINLQKMPGTAIDHLLRLKGVAETSLPPTADFPVRAGYDAGKVFAVLSLDATGRLARIEFYTTPEMKEKTAQYDYSAWREGAPGAWFAGLHQGVFHIAGVESKETTRFDNLSFNTPIPQDLFVPGPFFEGVKFVSEFKDIYK